MHPVREDIRGSYKSPGVPIRQRYLPARWTDAEDFYAASLHKVDAIMWGPVTEQRGPTIKNDPRSGGSYFGNFLVA